MRIKGIIFDMDGVIWRSSEPISGASGVIQLLAENDIPFVFATNNSSKTIQEYIEKLNQHNIFVDEDRIISSAVATGKYIHQNFPAGSSFYVIGHDGIFEQLDKYGFQHSENPDAAVIVGLDRDINYKKLKIASHLIQKGLPFIGSNPDSSFPSKVWNDPGAGAILAALEATTGVSPIIIGKPSKYLFEASTRILGFPADNVLMIGDRINTDIQGAKNAGIPACMVLTGISTTEDLENSSVKPDLLIDSILDLVPLVSYGQLNI